MGIRAETQIALDALDVSKRDRLRTEDSLATALAMAARRRETSAWRVVTAGFTLDASRASAVCCSSIELWRDVTEALSVETVEARES